MATAVTLRALTVYTPKPLATDYSQAVRKGVAWIAAAQPETNEDRIYQLLGLAWSGEIKANKDAFAKSLRGLIAKHADGAGHSFLHSRAMPMLRDKQ